MLTSGANQQTKISEHENNSNQTAVHSYIQKQQQNRDKLTLTAICTVQNHD